MNKKHDWHLLACEYLNAMRRMFCSALIVGWVNLDFMCEVQQFLDLFIGYSFLVHQKKTSHSAMRNLCCSGCCFTCSWRWFCSGQHAFMMGKWTGLVYSGKLRSNGFFPNVFQFSFILNFTLNTPLYSVY